MDDVIKISQEDEPQPPQTPHTSPTKPPRSYVDLKVEFKRGKVVVLTKEETTIYWYGKKEEEERKKNREEIATRQFWGATDRLTGNIFCKSLFYVIYAVWSMTPIVGIVIGVIYAQHDNCPARPSIAPLLIVLGLMSVLVGFSLVSQQTNKKKEDAVLNARRQCEEATVEGRRCLEPLVRESERIEERVPPPPSTLAQTAGVCAGGFIVCFIILFKILHLILFIATCVILYRFFPYVKFSKVGLSADEIESRFCNEVLFLFGFWSVTLSLIILVFLIVFCCCGCCTFVAWTAYASREPKNALPIVNAT